jgi:hypothetical protein
MPPPRPLLLAPGQGAGTMCDDDGSMYEGELSAGLRHGRGRFTSATGDVYEGCWQRNMRCACLCVHVCTCSQQLHTLTPLCTHVSSSATKPAGQHGAFAADFCCRNAASCQEGNTCNNTIAVHVHRHGTGTLMLASGDIYQGEWENDAKHGQGTYFHQGRNRRCGLS